MTVAVTIRGVFCPAALEQRLVDAEEPADLLQAFSILLRIGAAGTQNLLDEVERLPSGTRVVRKHRRNGGKGAFGIEQQHIELLADHRLEGRERYVAFSFADAAHRFEAARVNHGSRHADKEEPADDRFAQSAERNTPLEFGNPLLHQFVMQLTFDGSP